MLLKKSSESLFAGRTCIYKVSSLETLLVRGVMMYSAYPWVMSVFGKSTDGVA